MPPAEEWAAARLFQSNLQGFEFKGGPAHGRADETEDGRIRQLLCSRKPFPDPVLQPLGEGLHSLLVGVQNQHVAGGDDALDVPARNARIQRPGRQR